MLTLWGFKCTCHLYERSPRQWEITRQGGLKLLGNHILNRQNSTDQYFQYGPQCYPTVTPMYIKYMDVDE